MQDLTPEQIAVAKYYADKVVDAPLNELGGIISDQISHWRFKNKINLILKTKDFLDAKGLEPSKLLPDIFVPLVEEAGNISNETLSGMFASILANHLDPNSVGKAHPSYAKTLGQLSSLDAQILNELYQTVKDNDNNFRHVSLSADSAIQMFKRNRTEIVHSYENIYRLGICDRGHLNLLPPNYYNIFLTEYGLSFMDACHYK